MEERFHSAAQEGSLADVKKCIAAGVNVEAQTNDGLTALHLASLNSLEIVQYLLQNGKANVETQTNDGLTALHCASANGHLKIVQYLLQNGKANVEAQGNDGMTALHLASCNGHLEVVQ
jgi:ankyrin repeat protein